MEIHVYVHPRCSTCKKAINYLEEHQVPFETIDLLEHGVSKKHLEIAAGNHPITKLFNTSGMLYRELKLKDQVTHFSKQQAIDILSKEPMLVKRPFLVISKQDFVLIGFKEKEWECIPLKITN